MFIPHQLRRVGLGPWGWFGPQVIHCWPFEGGGSNVTSVAYFDCGLSVVFRLVFVRCAFGSVWVVGWPPFGDGCPLG